MGTVGRPVCRPIPMMPVPTTTQGYHLWTNGRGAIRSTCTNFRTEGMTNQMQGQQTCPVVHVTLCRPAGRRAGTEALPLQFHDPRPTTHDPRPTTHDPRPTTHGYPQNGHRVRGPSTIR